VHEICNSQEDFAKLLNSQSTFCFQKKGRDYNSILDKIKLHLWAAKNEPHEMPRVAAPVRTNSSGRAFRTNDQFGDYPPVKSGGHIANKNSPENFRSALKMNR
jgi:hypothetical protein